jgi:thiamine-phosphate pyrophosphorylase
MINLGKIYYISQGLNPETHLLNIEKVCKSGCQLIQLRIKNTDQAIILETARLALKICQKYNAKLIINDYLKIVEQLPSTGLHIGKNDLSIKDARRKLPHQLIGGTANTLEDCIYLANNNVDYIGLGPYAFTNTKANLDPLLGLEGYQDIIMKLKTLKITIPIYAIGGIEEGHIKPLFDSGLFGVAVSGLLMNSTEKNIKSIMTNYE